MKGEGGVTTVTDCDGVYHSKATLEERERQTQKNALPAS